MKKGKKNKVPVEVKTDENGNPILPEEKKNDVKAIGKKVLVGVGLVLGSILAFVAVGLAMDAHDGSSEDISFDGTDSVDSVGEGASNTGSSEGSES